MWTKSYLINLRCVYILYIINIYIVALFSDDWLLLDENDIYISVESRLFFDITFSIYYFIYVRAISSLRKYEIKLMFFPKSHILFAEEGQPIGPIGWWCAMIEMTMHAMGPPWGQVAPGWFLRCPGWQREPRWHWGVHLSTTTYLPPATTRAQWYVVKSRWNPSDRLLCGPILSSWSLGERASDRKTERGGDSIYATHTTLTTTTLPGRESFIDTTLSLPIPLTTLLSLSQIVTTSTVTFINHHHYIYCDCHCYWFTPPT